MLLEYVGIRPGLCVFSTVTLYLSDEWDFEAQFIYKKYVTAAEFIIV